MKILKKLAALITVFILVIPINVFAEEHICNPVFKGVDTTVTSSEEYCKITTAIERWECVCGYQLVTSSVETIPHNWIMQYQFEDVTSDGDYCSIRTLVTTYACHCGYQKEEREVLERIQHEWEMVCVDKLNNGYQRQCKTCGCKTGSIVYPASISFTEEY